MQLITSSNRYTNRLITSEHKIFHQTKYLRTNTESLYSQQPNTTRLTLKFIARYMNSVLVLMCVTVFTTAFFCEFVQHFTPQNRITKQNQQQWNHFFPCSHFIVGLVGFWFCRCSSRFIYNSVVYVLSTVIKLN